RHDEISRTDFVGLARLRSPIGCSSTGGSDIMRVMITGAAGFLGRRLTNVILKRGTLSDADGRERQVSKLYLVDLVDVPIPRDAGVEIKLIKGDLADPGFVKSLCETDFDSLFHMASFLTFRAEQDPDLAYAVNV